MKVNNEYWMEMFDYLYKSKTYTSKNDEFDYKFNSAGWIDSYGHRPIPREEMLDWKKDIVTPLKEMKPKRVLEVGCGTGMLMFELLEVCDFYVGTDISGNAVQNLKELTIGMDNVEIYKKSALELKNTDLGKFDLVIVNSVIQYFSDLVELRQVIEILCDKTSQNGCVFIGDVRNEDLNPIFYASIEQYQAKALLTSEELNSRIAKRTLNNPELSVSPCFFKLLLKEFPRIKKVENRLKNSCYLNEMTLFRYNVFLWLDQSESKETTLLWQNDLEQFDYMTLINETDSNIRIMGIPNKRLQKYFDFSNSVPINPNEICNRIMAKGIPVTIEINEEMIISHFDIILHKAKKLKC